MKCLVTTSGSAGSCLCIEYRLEYYAVVSQQYEMEFLGMSTYENDHTVCLRSENAWPDMQQHGISPFHLLASSICTVDFFADFFAGTL
jgi:hypothetical protein